MWLGNDATQMQQMTFTAGLRPDRAVLRIEGPDAAHFLHNLLTADIEALGSGAATYAALLTPQGKILFDLFARYQQSPGDLPAEWSSRDGGAHETEAERARRIGNFIAGMTDRFAITEHQRLFDSTPDLR